MFPLPLFIALKTIKPVAKDTLKRIAVYFSSPKTALKQIQTTGVKINEYKKHFVENFFISQIKSTGTINPYTVTSEDIKKCKPQQAVELIKRLALLECDRYTIPQNSLHFSEDISVKDGGQDGLVACWSQGMPHTNYFPSSYNCFQIKTLPLSPQKCKEEIHDNKDKEQLKPALQKVIKKRGAYILCSTQSVSGVHFQTREEILQKEIAKAGYNPDQIKIKFYDANIISNWLNQFPSLAVWFLQEVCGKNKSPWIFWEEWSCETKHKSEFIYNKQGDKQVNKFENKQENKLEDKPSSIYNILSKPRQTVRLSGPSGIGKTRLALEVFRPPTTFNFAQEKPYLSHLVLYSSSENLKESHLRELKTSRAILIIDDCSIAQAKKFQNIVLQENSKLSLLSIGYEEDPYISEHKVKLEPDKEITKLMLSKNPNIQSRNITVIEKLNEISSGFPLMAHLLEKVRPDILLSENSSDIQNKLLWGTDKEDSTAKKVIKACSLFDTIGFTEGWTDQQIIFSSTDPRGSKEAKYIAKKICKISYEEFYKKVQYFKSKQIIQQYGRFIQVRPKPLASWLAMELIVETPPTTIIKWLSEMQRIPKSYKLSSEEQKIYKKEYLSEKKVKEFESWNAYQLSLSKLLESFCKQFSYLELSSKAPELAQKLCGENSFFGKEEVLNTKWGANCFYHLSEANPEIALKTLKKVFGHKTTEELLKLKESRRDLVWTLQKLAVRKNLYPDSARLLLKLATAENEPFSNNSTGVFTDHFQIYLSGTEAPPEMKFQIIDEIQKSQSIEQKKIALQALDKALTTGGFSRSSDVVETRSGKNFIDWRPKTYGEQWDYFRKTLEYLTQFATEDQDKEINKIASNIIAIKLIPLLKQGLYKEVEKAIKQVLSKHGVPWPSAVNQLLLFLEYNSKTIKKEKKKQIENIINLLQHSGQSLNEKIQTHITNCPARNLYVWRRDKENTDYEKQVDSLVTEFKHLLEKGTDKEQIESILHSLFHGEQMNTLCFAQKTAESLKNPKEFLFEFINLIKQWQKRQNFNPTFLSGFISKLNNIDSHKTEKILDQIAKDNSLVNFLIPCYYSMDLKDRDITRLIKSHR